VAFADVFRKLAINFQVLSDVLHEVRDARDYMIMDQTLAKALGQDAMLGDSQETLLKDRKFHRVFEARRTENGPRILVTGPAGVMVSGCVSQTFRC